MFVDEYRHKIHIYNIIKSFVFNIIKYSIFRNFIDIIFYLISLIKTNICDFIKYCLH